MKIKSWVEVSPGTVLTNSFGQYWVADVNGNMLLLEGEPLSGWTPDRYVMFEEEYGPLTIVNTEFK